MTTWVYSSRLPDFSWKQRIIKGDIPAGVLSMQACAKRIFTRIGSPFSNPDFICALLYENIEYYVRHDSDSLVISTAHDSVKIASVLIPYSQSSLEICLLEGCKILTIGNTHST